MAEQRKIEDRGMVIEGLGGFMEPIKVPDGMVVCPKCHKMYYKKDIEWHECNPTSFPDPAA